MLNITHYQRNANRTTMRYHLTLLRMAGIKESTNNKCWRGCGEEGTLLHCWWGCKLVQPLWRTVQRFVKKLEIELPYDWAVPLLGIQTKENRIERDTCTPVFIAALFIIARTWKQPRWICIFNCNQFHILHDLFIPKTTTFYNMTVSHMLEI